MTSGESSTQTMPGTGRPSVRSTINFAQQADRSSASVFDMNTWQWTNMSLRGVDVPVFDARPINDELDLDVDGYRVFSHTSSVADSLDLAELDRDYHVQVGAFIKELTGARDVMPARDGLVVRHGARSGIHTGPRTDGNGERRLVQQPARFAHLDYTASSAEVFMGRVLAAEQREVAPYSRFAVFQTWRATSAPPQDNLLAVANGTTVDPDDVITFTTRMGDTAVGMPEVQARVVEHNPSQQWNYFSGMTIDEILVFKGWDSDSSRCGGLAHTAVDDPSAPEDAMPRSSVEARFFAFFE